MAKKGEAFQAYSEVFKTEVVQTYLEALGGLFIWGSTSVS